MSKVVRFDRDQIRAARSTKTKDVDAPELGKDVVFTVRGLTAGEQLTIAEIQTTQDEMVGGALARAALVKFCTVDGEGNRVFRDEDDDIISDMPADLTTRIATAAMSLSGLSESQLEEITGKAVAAPKSGDSVSD